MKIKILIITLITLIFLILLSIRVDAASTSLIINELMPNPKGSDTSYEWIEIRNISETVQSTESWYLNNSLLEKIDIKPKDHLIIARNKIELQKLFPDAHIIESKNLNLNNSGGKIILKNNVLEDIVEYPQSIEDQSFERVNECSNLFRLNTLGNTLGKENINYRSCLETQYPLHISINNAEFEDIRSAFEDERIEIKIEGYPKIKWYLDNIEQSTIEGKNLTFNSLSRGEHILKAEILADEFVEIEYTLTIYPRYKINEVMVNPDGADSGKEWIEVFDLRDNIHLEDWKICNKTDCDQLELFGKNFVIINPTFTLTNTTDNILLIAPNGKISDEMGYADANEDTSFSRTIDGKGGWSQDYEITKGQSNKPKITKKHSSKKTTIKSVPIKKTKDKPIIKYNSIGRYNSQHNLNMGFKNIPMTNENEIKENSLFVGIGILTAFGSITMRNNQAYLRLFRSRDVLS